MHLEILLISSTSFVGYLTTPSFFRKHNHLTLHKHVNINECLKHRHWAESVHLLHSYCPLLTKNNIFSSVSRPFPTLWLPEMWNERVHPDVLLQTENGLTVIKNLLGHVSHFVSRVITTWAIKHFMNICQACKLTHMWILRTFGKDWRSNFPWLIENSF